MIKEEFLNSLKNYTSADSLMLSMWNDIEQNYSKPGRHYHTLAHLDTLVRLLKPYEGEFPSWDTIVFAIAYHDVIYNTLKSTNEEKSAAYAKEKLNTIAFPEKQIDSCCQLILATKRHEASDRYTNLFTDADLSILGADPETYRAYAKQIRKEYSVYPDIVYNPGRKKVLLHFLAMQNIFKTSDFSTLYEANARVNLQEELKMYVS